MWRDRYRTKTFKGGGGRAQEALACVVAQAGAGTSSEGTFGALVERWFSVASVSKDWSRKTIVETRRIVDTKLGPLVPMALDKLRTSVLDDFYATLRDPGQRCRLAPDPSKKRAHANRTARMGNSVRSLGTMHRIAPHHGDGSPDGSYGTRRAPAELLCEPDHTRCAEARREGPPITGAAVEPVGEPNSRTECALRSAR